MKPATATPIGDNGTVSTEQSDDIRIDDGDIEVVVDAPDGGRISQIRFRGVDLLVDRDGAIPAGDPVRWGCYPMVPWAGRVRSGRFDLDGFSYQLPVREDGHALHGVGFSSPWEVVGRTGASVELSLDLPRDGFWPFGGSAAHRIVVADDMIRLELAVTAGDRRFPAVIGWHPWFRKPERLDFRPASMYRRVEGIAIDEQVDVPPGPWDDCFVNTEPVVATVAGVTVRLVSECTDWVVYDEPEHATCIEPQSGPPDAFNIRPFVLEPGDTLRRSFRIALAR